MIMITKTDQEITVTGKYKISLGVEIEVLHPYEFGVEIECMGNYYCMATKNAVEIWGGYCTLYYGMTKTDQEIIVSRKYESGVEIEGFAHYYCMATKNAVEKWGGNSATKCMATKSAHGDV